MEGQRNGEQEAKAIRARVIGQGRLLHAASVLTEALDSQTSTRLSISHNLELFNARLVDIQESHRMIEEVVHVDDLPEVILTHETFISENEVVRLRALQRLEDMAELRQPQAELRPSDSVSNIGNIQADFSGFQPGTNNQVDMNLTEVHGGIEEVAASTGVTTASNGNSEEETASGNMLRAKNIKLPKFELEILTDGTTNFVNWNEAFCFVVKNRLELSEFEKMAFLKRAVTGEAGRLVGRYSLATGDFDKAYNELERRYGRKSLLRLQKIRNLTSLTTPTGTGPRYIDSMFNFFDGIAANVHALSQLGVSGEVCEAFLCPNIVDRMPASIRDKWSTAPETEGREGDLPYLMEFIRREITGLQLAQAHTSSQPRERSGAVAHQQGSATALVVANGTVGAKAESKCVFCPNNATHTSGLCPKFVSASLDRRYAMLMNERVCFRCLMRGHLYGSCSKNCIKCQGPHHQKLCRQADSYGVSRSNSGATGGSTTPSALQWNTGKTQGGFVKVQPPPEAGPTNFSGLSGEAALTANKLNHRESVLQSACTYLRAKDGSCVKAMLVFDTGANRSYISRSMAHKLKPAIVGHEWVSYAAFGGESASRSMLSSIHRVELSDLGGGSHYLDLPEVPQICPPLTRSKIPAAALEVFSHLPLADDYGSSTAFTVDILIGADWYFHFVEPSTAVRSEGLVAMSTPFGYIVGGCWGGMTPPISVGGALMSVQSASLHEVHQFWSLESIGISPEETAVDHLDSHPVMLQLLQDLEYSAELQRYQVPILFKSEQHKKRMVNNSYLVEKRTLALQRKLAKEDIQEDYYSLMKEYFEDGIYEYIPDEEINNPSCYYMPQQVVIKRDGDSVKLRPVFDLSSKARNGLSVNDLIQSGPPLQPDIVSLTLRWRRWLVAISGDVQRAFLQIFVRPQDRDAFRFLLLLEGEMKHCRFLRVPFGGTSSPFLLNAVVRYHCSLFPESEVAKEMSDHMYVDNYLSGGDSEEEAAAKFQEATELLASAGLPLKKWDSSSERLIAMMEQQQVYKPEGKVLGLRWVAQDDKYRFKEVDHSLVFINTKRSLLSVFSTVYDPVGFLGPYILVAKFLFQMAWQLGVGWDEPLTEHLGKEFQAWIMGSRSLAGLEIPRQYFPGTLWREIVEQVEIHGFGDASMKGYGACVYLRISTSKGYEVSLVAARCRVAPLKPVTIPRLELLGALCCARLVRYVQKELRLTKAPIFCYTDSTITLAWLKGEPHIYKIFVGNRVHEIQTLVSPGKWFHCPGNLNPADMASRGMSGEELVDSKEWFYGPEWLRTQEACPQSNKVSETVINPQELELRPAMLITQSMPVSESWFHNFSSLQKIINFVSWMLRFMQNCKHKRMGQVKKSGPLTMEELEEGQTRLWRLVQKAQYEREIQLLTDGKPIPHS